MARPVPRNEKKNRTPRNLDSKKSKKTHRRPRAKDSSRKEKPVARAALVISRARQGETRGFHYRAWQQLALCAHRCGLHRLHWATAPQDAPCVAAAPGYTCYIGKMSTGGASKSIGSRSGEIGPTAMSDESFPRCAKPDPPPKAIYSFAVYGVGMQLLGEVEEGLEFRCVLRSLRLFWGSRGSCFWRSFVVIIILGKNVISMPWNMRHREKHYESMH